MPIDLATGLGLAGSRQCNIEATFSVHDASGAVLFGRASPTFRADIPPRTATIVGTPRLAAPGFSTRGLPIPGPNLQTNQFLVSGRFNNVPPVRIQPFAFDQPTAIDFTLTRVQRQFLRFAFPPQIKLEIETFDAPGGNLVAAVVLDVQESGVLLRAFGPSVLDSTAPAVYTVTVDVGLVIP
jgi:hypothetical protein